MTSLERSPIGDAPRMVRIADDVLYGIRAEALAELAGVEVKTAARWKRGAALPEPTRRLLRLRVRGELGLLSEAWQGWQLLRDQLVSPEGATYSPGAVRSGPLYQAIATELRTREAHAQRCIDHEPERQRRLQSLAVLQSALAAGERALEQLKEGLTTPELHRLFAAHPQTIERTERHLDLAPP